VRNLSISKYFDEGNNPEKNDVKNIIDYINKLSGQQITDETPIRYVMEILDTIKRNQEAKNIDDEVIKYIIRIIEQELIDYENNDLLLDINNPEIDNIYKNLCGKLTITINTGGKKYMRLKKTIRKKQKKKYTYKNKKMKYKFRI